MIDLQEAIERFDAALPREIQLEFSSDEFMAALQAAGERYGLNLISLAILLAVGEIDYEKLDGYLIDELSIDPAQAGPMATDLKESVFHPAIERLKFLDTNPAKDMTLEQQKNFAERIFSAGLLAELRHDPFIIGSINARLFYILARDEAFAGRLERALYNNAEIVSTKPILFDGLQVEGSVANWLKDYLRKFGNAADDSVSQTNFLLNSENAKGLAEADRVLLAKILKTYVNVKFFPDSMPSDDGSGWEILPGGDEVAAPLTESEPEPLVVSDPLPPAPEMLPVTPSRPVPPPPVSAVRPAARPQPPVPKPVPVSKKVIAEPKQAPIEESKRRPQPRSVPSNLPLAEDQPVASSAAASTRKPIETASPAPESEELLNLRNMLLQYPAGSLERSAIEDEIRKLEQR